MTQYLFQSGANIEEIEQQVTRGRFSMSLQASWNNANGRSVEFRHGLQELARDLKMEIRSRLVEHGASQRIALFVTKEPECPEAVVRAVKAGRIPAERLVVKRYAAIETQKSLFSKSTTPTESRLRLSY